MSDKQGYLTVATRSEEFLRFAINLRLSCYLNDPQRPFCLVIDEVLMNKLVETKRSHYFNHIKICDDDSIAWETKFNLFGMSPFEETMYIDADSLMVKSPEPAWRLVREKRFAVQGPKHFNGKWYGKTQQEIMDSMNIDYFPKFNGGFIFFDKSILARQVFEISKQIFDKDYQRLGFCHNKGLKADEPIIGIAMALLNIDPLPDSANIMFTILGIDYWFKRIAKLSLSLPKRKVYFNKNGKRVSPIILHCCGGLRESWRYRYAEKQLRKMVNMPSINILKAVK
jgi:hypothetical protein